MTNYSDLNPTQLFQIYQWHHNRCQTIKQVAMERGTYHAWQQMKRVERQTVVKDLLFGIKLLFEDVYYFFILQFRRHV